MIILQIKSLSKRYSKKDAFALKDFSIEVAKGELLALVGESGSGKTTLLRLIAGFEEPRDGEIFLNGNVIVDNATFIAPEKRRIGMVFQDYALFPHLSIYDNLSFGLSKWGTNLKKERVKEMLALVGLEGFEDRFPHQLSGGQQQRVALARALAPKPELILLDEPFSNLDAMLKEQVREDIKKIIKSSGTTAIFVTHDTNDALSTADRIVILKEGSAQQIGSPKDVYNFPVNAYVANFFGKVNILEASSTPNGWITTLGIIPKRLEGNLNKKVKLVIRPEHFELKTEKTGSYRCKIVSIIYLGAYKQIIASVHSNPNQHLLIKVMEGHSFFEGNDIYFNINTDKIQELE